MKHFASGLMNLVATTLTAVGTQYTGKDTTGLILLFIFCFLLFSTASALTDDKIK